MIHLRSVTKDIARTQENYPFIVPVIQSLSTLEFTSDVTFLVGENGSGKSTLLEALACAIGSITVGSGDAEADQTLIAIRQLAKALKLIWTKKTRKGFFMRSEDFFGFTKRLSQMKEGLKRDLAQVDEDYQGRSDYARSLASLPYNRELAELKRYYGEDLDANSHGESYFKLFQSRFVPGELYLLDEPEAPLSPTRQLSFIAMLHMLVKQDAQFIIATHSPIIMAYPAATILQFEDGRVEQISYDDLEHVRITRSFLNDPQAYLRHLLEE